MGRCWLESPAAVPSGVSGVDVTRPGETRDFDFCSSNSICILPISSAWPLLLSWYIDLKKPNQSMSSTRFSPSALRLIEKQRELASLLQLNQASRTLSIQLEQLSQQFALSADGIKVTESVVGSWQNVFRAAHLAIASRTTPPEGSTEEPIQTLVRIPVGEPPA
ncbi:hypothetical protein O181_017219 [Austropuccinia psidii MF-1]|uniref:DASH complex subunit DAD2 n=1 Tax=Austropuccinia psidii MF-1 TaxID=1389203 RepID=A0A9Q3GSJ9_9BASI|nr:hypothetical protein [Austropuccinia psidii MF-1]